MDSTDLPPTPPRVIESVIEGEAHPIVEMPHSATPDALHVVTCLLVGGGLEAADLLLAHARAWQARFAATPKLLPLSNEQTGSDLLRYALIGLIFDAEQRLRHSTASWSERLLRTVDMATAVARPLTDSWLMAPVRRPMQSMSLQMQAEVARLVRRGRVEEAISRVMATELTDEVVSVILAYLSNKPEVRRLIEEQGFSLAEEVVDEVRNQSAAADNFVEAIVRRLLHQAPRQPSPPPPPIP